MSIKNEHLSYHDVAVIMCAKDESLWKEYEKHLKKCGECSEIKRVVEKEFDRFETLRTRSHIEEMGLELSAGLIKIPETSQTSETETIKSIQEVCAKSQEIFEYDEKSLVSRMFLWKHIGNCKICSDIAQFLYPERFNNPENIMTDPFTEFCRNLRDEMSDIASLRAVMPGFAAVTLGEDDNSDKNKPEYMRAKIRLSKSKKSEYDVLVARLRQEDGKWAVEVKMMDINKKLPKDFIMSMYSKDSEDINSERIFETTLREYQQTNLEPGVYILSFNNREDMIPIVLNG